MAWLDTSARRATLRERAEKPTPAPPVPAQRKSALGPALAEAALEAASGSGTVSSCIRHRAEAVALKTGGAARAMRKVSNAMFAFGQRRRAGRS